MATFSEDAIDDLLYYARTGDQEEFEGLRESLCRREKVGVDELVRGARDAESGNGVLHMAAANGHHGTYWELSASFSWRKGRRTCIAETS